VALGWALAFLVVVFAVLICSWQVGDRAGTKAYARGEHALRQGVLGLALRRRTRRPAGEVLTISSSDAGETAGFFWVIAEQAAAATAVLAACITLLVIAWPLAIAVVIGTLVQALVVNAVSGGLRRRGYEAQKQAARLDAVSTDFATGLRVLGALGGASRAAERYVAESAVAAEAAYRAEKAAAGLTTLNILVSGLVFTGIAVLAGRLALDGVITIGGFVTAMGLAQTIRGPLQALGYLPAQIASKHGSATRIAEFTREAGARADAPGDPVDQAQPTASTAVAAPIPADVVARLTVDGETLDIAEGRVTGIRADPDRILDLARLFSGLRHPEPGELVIGNRDAAHLGHDGLRAEVFAPPHDAAVFTGSAAENIATEIDHARLTASAFDEVVERLPDGLAERVGERGLRLSGGQRQRLLLARALHQPQRLVVLHEPTTAIDPITEAQVAAGLAAEGRTIVLLTDRASLLSSCHRVHDLRGVDA
jgi:ABC-type bacteriocin/lantibiotic exporter with double-glycine peptidase domain